MFYEIKKHHIKTTFFFILKAIKKSKAKFVLRKSEAKIKKNLYYLIYNCLGFFFQNKNTNGLNYLDLTLPSLALLIRQGQNKTPSYN